ncbi:MAG: glycosyltransferase [Bacteroidia bacterium]
MKNNSNILFLLVNYYNEKELCAFINEQLQPTTNHFIEIIITDNGSKEASLLTQIETQYDNVTLIKSQTNLGYFGAANLGLTHYLKQHTAYPQAVIICNTDITLQSDFFKVLQNKLASQNFDVLGPSIYSTFLKHYQNPYIINRTSKSKLQFLHSVSSNYLLYSAFTAYHVLKTKISGAVSNKINTSLNPYALHGSFMIFNKTFFTKGGTINYPAVLFGEELFIAEQALKLNLNIVYEPTLQVEHNEHATTGIFKSHKTVAFLHQSYTYLLKTFF